MAHRAALHVSYCAQCSDTGAAQRQSLRPAEPALALLWKLPAVPHLEQHKVAALQLQLGAGVLAVDHLVAGLWQGGCWGVRHGWGMRGEAVRAPRAAPTLTALALPADSTVPCVGRFCAELGSRMPPTVLLSASSAFTNTRSPTGVTVLTCRWQAGGGWMGACGLHGPHIAMHWAAGGTHLGGERRGGAHGQGAAPASGKHCASGGGHRGAHGNSGDHGCAAAVVRLAVGRGPKHPDGTAKDRSAVPHARSPKSL